MPGMTRRIGDPIRSGQIGSSQIGSSQIDSIQIDNDQISSDQIREYVQDTILPSRYGMTP